MCKKTRGRRSCDIPYTSTQILTFDCRFQEIAVQYKNLHNTRKLLVEKSRTFSAHSAASPQAVVLANRLQGYYYNSVLQGRMSLLCRKDLGKNISYYSGTHLCEAKFSVCYCVTLHIIVFC